MPYCVGPRKPCSVYLAYALLCEGPSDFAYFEVLIPRLIDSIVGDLGIRPVDRPDTPALRLGQPNRAVEAVATEACRAKDAIHLAFIHADTGGRNQEGAVDTRSVAYCRKMHEICEFPQPRCVLLRPRHETEAWVLADPNAVLEALGYKGPAVGLGLPGSPREAERHQDPKACLDTALRRVTRNPRRRARTLLPAIAQRQSIAELRQSASFSDFESRLKTALQDLGILAPD